MAWLTGWNKRKSKTINGSTAGTQTDYQMKMIVHKNSGTDSTTDTYLGTNVRDDFGDVRFTSSDGTTLLDYWIESYTSGSVATIWIKIPSIPASPSSINIYIYHENYSVTTTSDSANTFVGFATGGTITIYNQYRIHTINSSDIFTPSKNMNVEALVVAGGGSGGSGGGGAGGLTYNATYGVSPGAMSVIVGLGGAAPPGTTGNDGSNSVFGTLTAIGGGGGGTCAAGRNGGSGGGGGAICIFTNGGYPGGAGTTGQGNSGGSGYQQAGSWYAMGGGGGAGTAGSNSSGAGGGVGGIGLAYSITGSSAYYAGGGGGTSNDNTSGGAGGAGGGGNWNVDGTPNTGGGGGGNFKVGGSGIVIVRYVYRQIVSPEPTFSAIGIEEIFQITFDTLMIAGD